MTVLYLPNYIIDGIDPQLTRQGYDDAIVGEFVEYAPCGAQFVFARAACFRTNLSVDTGYVGGGNTDIKSICR